MTATQPHNLTQTAAARWLGVTDRTLRNWEAKGLIKGHSPAGGVKLYSIEDLKRLTGKES